MESVNGIYLLAHPSNGKLYVGSAYGDSGLWGRWESYLDNGHGGNVMLRQLGKADYQVSVLEVASSTTSLNDVIELENRWKEKLLTRIHGLNRN
ncbi:GIY-YIG nuclease family protein [Thiohalomonas denitrificans]|uniref:GIY-YIG nuclease family protein n=1 Tax=Thiohalomonas denitrificans TaxID=415747 RepID=UPI0026EBF411|nr:GIY-YIG nuclease family protein [Thiohalomonas denitrificans]